MWNGKFVLIAGLLCLSICLGSKENEDKKLTTWGKVTSCVLATRRVLVVGTWSKVTNHTLNYPEVSQNTISQNISLKFHSHFNQIFCEKIINSIVFYFGQGRQSQYQIVGIEHFDHEFRPVNATIVKGGIGHRSVSIEIQTQAGCGINSTFVFYTFKKLTF